MCAMLTVVSTTLNHHEQTPKQVRGDVTFQGDGTLRGDRVGKCHAKDVRVKPEHDKAALAVAE